MIIGHQNILTMKTFLSFVLFLLIINSVQSQNYSKSFDIPGGTNTIYLQFKWSDITVVKGNTNQIIVEGELDINGGEGNDEFILETEKSGNTFSLVGDVNVDNLEDRVTIKLEDGTKKIYMSKEAYENDNTRKAKWVNYGKDIDVDLTITIPSNMDLQTKTTYGKVNIENITSNIDVKATYGSVDIKLGSDSSPKSLRIESTYSDVDVSIPSNLGADLEIKTSYGEVYTDLDFEPQYGSKSHSSPFGEDITAKLNGGGIPIELESGYSNVYLRKS